MNSQDLALTRKLIDKYGGGGSGTGATIDDTTLAKDKVWSSQKTYDFTLANANTTFTDINGGDMQTINYTKEGYLSEAELFGSQENQNLGKLVVDGIGNPILDSQGRQQYNINVMSKNKNVFDGVYQTTVVGSYGFYYYGVETYTITVTEKNNSIDLTGISLGFCNNSGTNISWLFNNNILNVPVKTLTDSKLCYYPNNEVTFNKIKSRFNIQIELGNSSTTYSNHTSTLKTFTLPCQLQKVGEVKDRLYFDKAKGKYVVEKNNVATKGIPQIIETNITKEMLVPTYRGRTYIKVTDNVINGGIKAKVPIDAGQAVQGLSARAMSLEEENANLRNVNEEQDQLINVSMLATDELYTMIEPSLPQAMSISMMSLGQEENINMEVKNPMVDMYVAMVLRGLKTIDEVPVRFREDVRKVLEQLES